MPRKVPTAVAARILGKSENFIRFGLQQGRLPFGSAVKTAKDRWSYHIDNYLKSIGFDYNFVSAAKICDIVLTTDGVADCENFTANGSFTRIAIPDKDIPVMGEVTLNVVGTYDDGTVNLGSEPPTMKQIEVLAQVTAVIADECDLRLDSNAHVMTHCEAAWLDGYGVPYGATVNGVKQDDPDLRWDLMKLPDHCCDGSMVNGGDLIRGKAAWYLRKWRSEFMGD